VAPEVGLHGDAGLLLLLGVHLGVHPRVLPRVPPGVLPRVLSGDHGLLLLVVAGLEPGDVEVLLRGPWVALAHVLHERAVHAQHDDLVDLVRAQ
jgi:hypothetical protein